MSLGAARPAVRIPALRAKVAELPLAPLAMTILTAAVFVVRLTQMHQSLFGDEVWTYLDLNGRSLAALVRHVHTGLENSPPLFFVLAWLSAKLGDPTVWIRLPSLILGTATIPLLYLLGREVAGRWPGLIGAAIFALSPFSAYYGIEARPYATMAFFIVLSTLALVRAVRSGSPRWWLLYALATAGAAYSHYTSIFVLAAQAGWSLWVCRDRLRQPLLANALVVLLYIPWLPYVRGKQLVIGALEPLSFHNVVKDALRPVPGYPYASLRAIPTRAGLFMIGAFAVAGLLALAWRWRRASRLPERLGDQILLPVLAVVTPIGILVYSLLGPDVWDARSLYASVPAAALTLGVLLYVIPRPVAVVAVAAVLTVLGLGTARALGPKYARPPFRAAAQYLDSVARPRDPILFYPAFLDLDLAIRAQFHKPHLQLDANAAAWRSARSATTTYAVIDDVIAQAGGSGIPHPSGFRLVASRHYTGLFSFRVLTYRPLRPVASRTRSRTRTA